jgi:hypothetical protein
MPLLLATTSCHILPYPATSYYTLPHPTKPRPALSHDGAVCRWLRRVIVFVLGAALVLPISPSIPTIVSAIIATSVLIQASITNHHPVVKHAVIRHSRAWSVRSSQAVIMRRTVDRKHGWISQTPRHQRRVAPCSRDRIAAANLTAQHLIASPWSLHHFNRLPVCKSPVTHRAGHGRCNKRLVGFASRAAEEIRQETAGLAHGHPCVATGGRVVQSAAAHCGRREADVFRLERALTRIWMQHSNI